MRNLIRKFIAIAFLIGIYTAYTFYMNKKTTSSLVEEQSEGKVVKGEKSAPKASLSSGLVEIKNKKHFELNIVDSAFEGCFRDNVNISRKYKNSDEFKEGLKSKLGEYQNKSFSWQNIHFENNQGDIMRLRVFMDDGPNGERKKLVLYKESGDELPVPVEISNDDRWNPSVEVIQKYVGDGRVLYDELAESFNFSDGSVFLRKVGGKIVETQVSAGEVQFECSFQ